MDARFLFLPYVRSIFSWRLIQLFRAFSLGLTFLTMEVAMKGRIGPSLRSTVTLRPDFPESIGALGLAIPRWVRRARAIPSTDQMSGWLLSLTSTLTLSFCSSRDSTSSLTYARISLSPSSSRGTFCPRRSSRSVRENWTDGVLGYLLLPYPFEACSEELSDVLG